MKIMVISLDNQLIERMKLIFSKENYDYIHYSDSQKALDNVTEIDPDLILYYEDQYPDSSNQTNLIIQSCDIYKNYTVIYLSEKYHQSYENGIYKMSPFLDDNQSIDYLNTIIKKKQTNESPNEFIFTHPITNNLIMGQIDKYHDGIFEFYPAMSDSAASIVENTPIPCCTLKHGETFFTFPALVIENNVSMKFQIDKKFIKKIKLANIF